MAVVLIGAPAAGKTRLGKRLARRLDREFVDTDAVVVAEHGPIPALFAERGEAAFRALEREAVRAALQRPAVVSLGGGAVLDPDTRAELADHDVVLLTISREAVAPRLDNAKRPLITSLEAWDEIVERRRELYASLADTVTDTSSRPMDEIADEIAEWARSRG